MAYVTVFALAVVALVAIAALLHTRSHALRRRVSERLPVGADGVIAGAGAFELTAGDRAVLLLHGFGDTPQTLRLLGLALHRDGWTVSAPLLPGHGRTLAAQERTGAEDWLAAARASFREMCERYPHVAIVGLSMGGALATVLAATEERVEALVLLAPYLSMPPAIRRLTRAASFWQALTPVIETRSDGSILDPSARGESLGYGASTPRLLAQLGGLAEQALALAPRVRVPMLMVHSRTDNRIGPAAAQAIFDHFHASPRELVWLSASGHVVTVDREREQVFRTVSAWLAAHVAGPARADVSAD